MVVCPFIWVINQGKTIFIGEGGGTFVGLKLALGMGISCAGEWVSPGLTGLKQEIIQSLGLICH